jgi:hypothetical protein
MSNATGRVLQLTEVPEVMNWPETHYVFIEKVGRFKIPPRKRGNRCINLCPKSWNKTKSPGT